MKTPPPAPLYPIGLGQNLAKKMGGCAPGRPQQPTSLAVRRLLCSQHLNRSRRIVPAPRSPPPFKNPEYAPEATDTDPQM